jgi:hypothetical protein
VSAQARAGGEKGRIVLHSPFGLTHLISNLSVPWNTLYKGLSGYTDGDASTGVTTASMLLPNVNAILSGGSGSVFTLGRVTTRPWPPAFLGRHLAQDGV